VIATVMASSGAVPPGLAVVPDEARAGATAVMQVPTVTSEREAGAVWVKVVVEE
jgi:hypothetical protein